MRNCVRGRWNSWMRKKAEWDAWNPDRDHPFIQWINESKIAGLKETVKPDRGIIYRILWRSENCTNYFRSVLTNHGVSCSFNNLPLHKLHRQNENPTLRSTWENKNHGPWKFADWDKWSTDSYVMENGKGRDGEFPARQKLGERPWGLSFIHKMEGTGDCPQFDSFGSRITISVPGTDFDVAKLNVVIPPKSEVFVELIPELITADEGLRDISPELRGCYFQDEKPLANIHSHVSDCFLKQFDTTLISQ